MPPKSSQRKTSVVKKKNVKANSRSRKHQLPEHFPPGEIFTDIRKSKWVVGETIGRGGFGEIYLAKPVSSDDSRPAGSDSEHVIKIEPKDNGPLFVEISFYQRAGKKDMIEEWKKSQKLKHLGVPAFVSMGTHTNGSRDYRFLVMKKFGQNLHNLFEASAKQFSVKTAFTLGIQILDVLKYLHAQGYSHGDIKGSNLLLGVSKQDSLNKAYLVDFGLAYRFLVDGKHKEYKEDPRLAHDGTVEFTSIDAHKGVKTSRRSDLEILGYVMLQWLCGRLPWEDNLADPGYVRDQKIRHMSNIPALMKACFPAGKGPKALQDYLEYVKSLDYFEEPDYKKLQGLLREGIKKAGSSYDGKFDFTTTTTTTTPASPPKKPRKRSADASPAKVPAKAARKPPAKKAPAAKAGQIPGGKKTTQSKVKPPPVGRQQAEVIELDTTSDEEGEPMLTSAPRGRGAASPKKSL